MGKQKRKIIIISLVGLLLIMAISYAAFSSVLNIQGTTSISSNWDIKITNVTSKDIVGSASNQEEPSWENLTATFNTNLVSPGDSITYEITVSNEGTLNAKLDKITLSDTSNPAIKFETSGLTEGDILNAGSNTTLNVKVSYDINITSQPTSTISVLTANLEYSQANGSESSGQTAAEQLIAKVIDTGDGLYEDFTEIGRYVYKGTNPDNYITFNGENWRIVSVETDNTIKIIRNDNLNNMPAYSNVSGTPTNTAVAPIDFGYVSNMPAVNKVYQSNDNTRYSAVTTDYCGYATSASDYSGCNVWGSRTTMLDANGNHVTKMAREIGSIVTYDLPEEDAYLNTYLNGTYYTSLSNEAKDQVQEHSFNVGVQNIDINNTLVTEVAQEKANTWKGKVGLIQVTDYIKASTDSSCINMYSALFGNDNSQCQNNNYLYNGTNYWTMSPYSYSTSYIVWGVYAGGSITSYSGTNIFGVRPVIYLKSNISLSGSGTSNDPYAIIA